MKTAPILLSVLLLAMAKLPLGCGSRIQQSPKPAAMGPNTPAAQASVAPEPVVKPLPLPATGPMVIITSPVKDEEVNSTDVGVFLEVKDWPGDRGAHVHVVLDDLPPEDVADPMLPTVFRHVKPGLHVARAFACRSDHVSYKNPAALATVWFRVAGEGKGAPLDPAAPTLTFNQPGAVCSRDAAKRLPVDFLLSGVAMDDLAAWRVRVSLDGEQKFVLDASNYLDVFLPPLEAGEHAVRLELMDSRGRAMKANFAWSERIVSVR
ncbi:MAG: hypothetical protein HZC54_06910 [Verrucomicrobia bacterium]|nr:hypothetical protein [Verrucomicrobiota bacterium]